MVWKFPNLRRRVPAAWHAICGRTFHPYFVFKPGDSYRRGDAVLTMQLDGNLVLVDRSPTPRWTSGTTGYPAAQAHLQTDGNLVIYWRGRPVWLSGTRGNYGSRLVLYDRSGANLVIYNSMHRVIWRACA